jgi:subtilisin family serine protease
VRKACFAAAAILILLHSSGSRFAAPPSRQVILHLKADGRTVQQAQAALAASLPPGVSILHPYQTVAALTATVTADGLAALEQNPLIDSIQLDKAALKSGSSQNSDRKAGPLLTSPLGLSGAGVRVAVLDSGVDVNHPDLKNDIVAQHCFSSDGDCLPYHTTESDSAQDASGHGTSIASIITSDGVVGPAGIAPAAQIVAVRVLDQHSDGWVSDWIAGLDWIAANQGTLHVNVVNMSLGTADLYRDNCDADWPELAEVVGRLRAMNITVFASTGNQGSDTGITAPACNSGVIAVGATYEQDIGAAPARGKTFHDSFGGNWPACDDLTTGLDIVACFTNSNGQLDVLAPGAPVVADQLGGSVATFWGTSHAVPMAAGVAALMLQARPDLTPDDIEARLKQTGSLIIDPKNGLHFPAINPQAALQSVVGQ